MKLVSINVSLPRMVELQGRSLPTGIYKESVNGPRKLSKLNLEGDAQADRRVHGGPNKAVYAYGAEHYSYWKKELGKDYGFGQFGENFTVEGMDEKNVFIGQAFAIGSAKLAITQPRTPCFKLGIKMGDSKFPIQFFKSGRLGFYLCVIEEGIVTPGDIITPIESSPHSGISIHQFWRMATCQESNRELILDALKIPTLGREWITRLHEALSGF